MTKRNFHSLSALQLSSNNVLLVLFGGEKSRPANTVLIELSEYYQCIVYAVQQLVTDTGQLYCKHNSSSPPVQRDKVGWSVRKVLKVTDLEYKIVYQQMLSKCRSTTVEGVIHPLEEV